MQVPGRPAAKHTSPNEASPRHTQHHNCGQAYIPEPTLLEHTASASLPYMGVCALQEKEHHTLLYSVHQGAYVSMHPHPSPLHLPPGLKRSWCVAAHAAGAAARARPHTSVGLNHHNT